MMTMTHYGGIWVDVMQAMRVVGVVVLGTLNNIQSHTCVIQLNPETNRTIRDDYVWQGSYESKYVVEIVTYMPS